MQKPVFSTEDIPSRIDGVYLPFIVKLKLADLFNLKVKEMSEKMEELEDCCMKLQALEQCGVDGWSGYEMAMMTYDKWKEIEDEASV